MKVRIVARRIPQIIEKYLIRLHLQLLLQLHLLPFFTIAIGSNTKPTLFHPVTCSRRLLLFLETNKLHTTILP